MIEVTKQTVKLENGGKYEISKLENNRFEIKYFEYSEICNKWSYISTEYGDEEYAIDCGWVN